MQNDQRGMAQFRLARLVQMIRQAQLSFEISERAVGFPKAAKREHYSGEEEALMCLMLM